MITANCTRSMLFDMMCFNKQMYKNKKKEYTVYSIVSTWDADGDLTVFTCQRTIYSNLIIIRSRMTYLSMNYVLTFMKIIGIVVHASLLTICMCYGWLV